MGNCIYNCVWNRWLYNGALRCKNRKVDKKEKKMKQGLLFEISCDNGYTENIEAKCRKEVVQKYIETSGMPMWYFKEHCVVRNKGLMEE